MLSSRRRSIGSQLESIQRTRQARRVQWPVNKRCVKKGTGKLVIVYGSGQQMHFFLFRLCIEAGARCHRRIRRAQTRDGSSSAHTCELGISVLLHAKHSGLRAMQTEAKRNLGHALRGFGADDAEAEANNLRQATRARTLSATTPHALGSVRNAFAFSYSRWRWSAPGYSRIHSGLFGEGVKGIIRGLGLRRTREHGGPARKPARTWWARRRWRARSRASASLALSSSPLAYLRVCVGTCRN